MSTQAGTNTAPGIFWVISLVSLVWNAFGLMVYWLTQIRYPAVMAQTPPAMILGSVVNGTGPMKQRKVFLLPWGALFEIDGKPAVWVIDPTSNTVSLKPIDVDRYNRGAIAVTSGIESGQIVVTAGVQMLRQGQKVEIATETRP